MKLEFNLDNSRQEPGVGIFRDGIVRHRIADPIGIEPRHRAHQGDVTGIERRDRYEGQDPVGRHHDGSASEPKDLLEDENGDALEAAARDLR